MGEQLAIVLNGGGSCGALQAGALRVLVEAGYQLTQQAMAALQPEEQPAG